MIHTPTPWTYHKHGNKDWIEDANTDIVVEAVGLLDGPFICEAVNNHDRLTAEVARLTESLAECVEALVFLQDRAHMRVNPPTVEKAQKLLNPKEPK